MVQHGKRYAIKMLGDIPDTMLPDGWIGVYHISGAIVYLHRETRVVTWSRPYKISKETSLRAHNIPLLSIPCLHQKLAIDKYLEKSDTTSKRTCPMTGSNGPSPAKMPKPDENGDGEDIPVTFDSLLNGVGSSSSSSTCPITTTSGSSSAEGSNGETVTNALPNGGDIVTDDGEKLGSNSGNSLEPQSKCNGGNDGNDQNDNGIDGNNNNNSDDKVCPPLLENIDNQDNHSEENNVSRTEINNNESTEDQKNILNTTSNCNDASDNISIINNGHNDNINCEGKDSIELINNCDKTNIDNNNSKNSDDNNNSSNNNNNNNQGTEDGFIVLDEAHDEDEHTETTDNHVDQPSKCPVDEPTSSRGEHARPLKRKHSETNDTEFDDVCRENDLLCSCRKTGNVDNPNEVTPTSMHEYLSEIFGFEIMSIEKFKGTVFSCKSHHQNYPSSKEPTAPLEKKFNIVGKTPGQILNEYCQWRKTTVPTFTQVDRHSHHEFTVELTIENLKLGMGSGGNLKQARHNAALHTLNILDHTILNEEDPFAHVAVFDQIPVDDKAVLPQIEKLSMTGVKLPYETLLHLLFRNFPTDFSESDIEFVVEELNPVRRKYTMRYKDYGVTGFCENWQPVREVAAQVLIAVMYPLIPNWGTVIRLVEGYIDVAGNPDLPTKKVRLKRGENTESSRREMKKGK